MGRYEVERVVAVKTVKSKSHDEQNLYLVKWKGYPSEQNTWEPLENLDNCQQLLNEFFTASVMFGAQAASKKMGKPRRELLSDDEEYYERSRQSKKAKKRRPPQVRPPRTAFIVRERTPPPPEALVRPPPGERASRRKRKGVKRFSPVADVPDKEWHSAYFGDGNGRQRRRKDLEMTVVKSAQTVPAHAPTTSTTIQQSSSGRAMHASQTSSPSKRRCIGSAANMLELDANPQLMVTATMSLDDLEEPELSQHVSGADLVSTRPSDDVNIAATATAAAETKAMTTAPITTTAPVVAPTAPVATPKEMDLPTLDLQNNSIGVALESESDDDGQSDDTAESDILGRSDEGDVSDTEPESRFPPVTYKHRPHPARVFQAARKTVSSQG